MMSYLTDHCYPNITQAKIYRLRSITQPELQKSVKKHEKEQLS